MKYYYISNKVIENAERARDKIKFAQDITVQNLYESGDIESAVSLEEECYQQLEELDGIFSRLRCQGRSYLGLWNDIQALKRFGTIVSQL